jgi:hypothetical protein
VRPCMVNSTPDVELLRGTQMTIGIAWVERRTDGREDLYFASDSRTRGIRVLDLSPKILLLPRSDCALCVAGDTSATYALMLQVSAAIGAHEPARERNLDIVELKRHLLRVLTDTVNSVQDAAEPFTSSDAQLIFGGYSWRTKQFQLWTMYYEEKAKRFRARDTHRFHARLPKAVFVGDQAKPYRAALWKALESASNSETMLPLKTLAKMLERASIEESIGGAPQVARIGPHMNSRHMTVLWGKDRDRYLLGRKLFAYENCDYHGIDPLTGLVETPRHFAVPTKSRS